MKHVVLGFIVALAPFAARADDRRPHHFMPQRMPVPAHQSSPAPIVSQSQTVSVSFGRAIKAAAAAARPASRSTGPTTETVYTSSPEIEPPKQFTIDAQPTEHPISAQLNEFTIK